MATRKALVLVSGLFQELNSSSDKLDFAGNSTSDLSEGTNQYFTTTRARTSVSVTDSGGLGSLGYNNSTGVITYAGPSNSDIRGLVSIASGSGLTYNSSTGEFGTNAIPNAQLANSSVTLGASSVSLGATISSITNMTSIRSDSFLGGTLTLDDANSAIIFEGTANAHETNIQATDPTADRTITFPDATGTVALTSDIVYPVTLTNSVTLTNKTLTFGNNTISGTLAQFNTAVTDATLVSTTGTETLTNKSLTAPTLTGSSSSAGSIIFKEDTDNGTNSATLIGPAATADVTITLPAETGTVLTTASSIANSNLANSTVTIGSSAVALGSSVTTLTGITSLTADAVVAKANGFRVIDPTDATKQVAFDASGVATSTTRTLTVPNKNGSILTEVADDTSPQLGGNLETNGNNIKIEGDDKIDFASYAEIKRKTAATNAGGGYVQQNSLVIDGLSDDIWLSNSGQKITFGSSDSTAHEVARIQCAAVGASQHGFVYLNYVVANAGGSASSSTKLATTQTGVTITGVCTATSFTGALNSAVTATTQSASDNSTKVATTAYVDNQVTAGAVNEFSDNVFRVKDNSDASKKLAFECSGISGSTTRTMTVPNTDGTISTESFATAIAVALG